jgi:hypothetical protein
MNNTQGKPQAKDAPKPQNSRKRKENTTYWNDLQFEQMVTSKKTKIK